MKKSKLIKLIIAFLILAVTLVVATGCDNKKEDPKVEKKEESSIIGTWVDENEIYTYEYKEDGKALMNGKEANYTLEGNTLTIKYDDNTKLFKYKYTIDNTSLTLENEEGNKYVYVKK